MVYQSHGLLRVFLKKGNTFHSHPFNLMEGSNKNGGALFSTFASLRLQRLRITIHQQFQLEKVIIHKKQPFYEDQTILRTDESFAKFD